MNRETSMSPSYPTRDLTQNFNQNKPMYPLNDKKNKNDPYLRRLEIDNNSSQTPTNRSNPDANRYPVREFSYKPNKKPLTPRENSAEFSQSFQNNQQRRHFNGFSMTQPSSGIQGMQRMQN